MENCQNYQYEIPLTMARTSGAKYLNDQILAGRNKVSASRNNVLAKPSLQVRESFHVVGVYF